jgi:tetratricopeptide (TPR) repeat protein
MRPVAALLAAHRVAALPAAHRVVALLLAAHLFAAPAAATALHDADAHYARRAESHADGVASPAEIDLAISGYEEAARDPAEVAARWKLARALYFRGAYTGLAPSRKIAIFQRARDVSDEAQTILAQRAAGRYRGRFDELAPADVARALAPDPDAAPTLFWAAVSWGEWALSRGRLAAARSGAPSKIRDLSLALVAIDPRFEEGGGYRILGRLHDQAPRIPFLTGWVSREQALRCLREAVRIAPRNLVNRHFLAEALAKGSAVEREEARALERAVVTDAPSPDHLVEELALQEQAKRNLEAWK